MNIAKEQRIVEYIQLMIVAIVFLLAWFTVSAAVYNHSTGQINAAQSVYEAE